MWNFDIVTKIVLNTLFVSIPEEIFPMALCLFLLRRFNIFRHCRTINKTEINWSEANKFFIPVVISALVSNILRYTGVNNDIGTLAAILSMVILTTVIFKISSSKEIVKTFVFTIVGAMIMLIIEIALIPVIKYLLGKTLFEINQSVALNFVTSIPLRVICFSILTILVLNKVNILDINVIKSISRSKASKISSSICLLLNTYFLYHQWKLVCVENIQENLPVLNQVMNISFIIVFPILNILALWIIIYSIESYRSFRAKLIKNKLNMLINSLENFYINGQNEKIVVAINDIKSNIEEIV